MRYLTVFFCLFFLGGCISALDFSPDKDKPTPIVNCVFTGGSVFNLRLTESAFILDTLYAPLAHAGVVIQSDTQKDTLKYEGNGWYRSDLVPVSGRDYQLKIGLENGDSLRASSYLPAVPQIDSGYIRKIDENDGEFSWDISFNIRDDANTANYYEMVFVSAIYSSTRNYTDLGILASAKTPDIVVQKESNLALNPKSFLFSDQLFNGQTYRMRMLMVNGSWHGGRVEGKWQNNITNHKRYVVLRAVSKAYFEVAKSWVSHQYFQQTDNNTDDKISLIFLGEPQNLRSNIAGGTGIFGGYQEVIYELQEQ